MAVNNSNPTLTLMDRSSEQKINMETLTLNDTLDQIHLIDRYRTSHPKKQNTRSFKCTWNILHNRYVMPQNKSIYLGLKSH